MYGDGLKVTPVHDLFDPNIPGSAPPSDLVNKYDKIKHGISRISDKPTLYMSESADLYTGCQNILDISLHI